MHALGAVLHMYACHGNCRHAVRGLGWSEPELAGRMQRPQRSKKWVPERATLISVLSIHDSVRIRSTRRRFSDTP